MQQNKMTFQSLARYSSTIFTDHWRCCDCGPLVLFISIIFQYAPQKPTCTSHRWQCVAQKKRTVNVYKLQYSGGHLIPESKFCGSEPLEWNNTHSGSQTHHIVNVLIKDIFQIGCNDTNYKHGIKLEGGSKERALTKF